MLHLVEISPALAGAAGAHAASAWRCRYTGIAALDDVPKGPAIIVANEFFDALPVEPGGEVRVRLARAPDRHRCRRQSRLHHRARPDAAFRPPAAAGRCATRPPASIFEWRADTVAMELGRRLADDGGAALVIDYGHAESAVGDTLAGGRPARLCRSADRARQHRPHRACRFPGARRARSRRWAPTASGRSTQSQFLRRLGIETRAATLKAKAAPRRRRDRFRAGAPDRRRPHRHGRAVQGGRLRASLARRAARISKS